MSTAASARQRFAALVGDPGERLDLTEAALLIAAEAYPGLDLDQYRRTLDDLASGAAPGLRAAGSDLDRVRALIAYLAGEQRFSGNQADYYDRRNSFLTDVLDRRTGIPITLALVYIEVARRLDLPVVGVGFPGHFLAKYAGAVDVVFDPFFGRVLSEPDCAARLHAALGAAAPFDRRHLRAATPREILVRILRNLKHIHLQAREFEAALTCSDRILLVEPGLAAELRDRGLLYQQLDCLSAARADLERFLELAPHDDGAAVVRERLIALRRHAGSTLH